MNVLLYNIMKAIHAAATKMFINVARAQSSTRQCLLDHIFDLTFMFLSWNWEKVYSSLLR